MEWASLRECASDAQEILWPWFRTFCRISLPRWARAPPAQGDHAAHIDAFKAAIGCIEIIAKDPPWHQRILRHSESAAATGRISFGPVSNGHHSESAPATRRRSFGPGFAHSAGSLCQDGRERRLHRVIMQRTLTPSRLPLAALRSLQRIRLGISVSYVIQRVHDSPVEIMGPAAEAAAWNGHQRILGSR